MARGRIKLHVMEGSHLLTYDRLPRRFISSIGASCFLVYPPCRWNYNRILRSDYRLIYPRVPSSADSSHISLSALTSANHHLTIGPPAAVKSPDGLAPKSTRPTNLVLARRRGSHILSSSHISSYGIPLTGVGTLQSGSILVENHSGRISSDLCVRASIEQESREGMEVLRVPLTL
jgi:hypothetical protein